VDLICEYSALNSFKFLIDNHQPIFNLINLENAIKGGNLEIIKIVTEKMNIKNNFELLENISYLFLLYFSEHTMRFLLEDLKYIPSVKFSKNALGDYCLFENIFEKINDIRYLISKKIKDELDSKLPLKISTKITLKI
jgi:hypothetical protein